MRVLLPLIALALAACTHQTQTTSGADYLAGYVPPAPVVAAPTGAKPDPAAKARSLDDTIRLAAQVEPSLRLPARFGIARIANRRLVPIPEAEAKVWQGWAAQSVRHGEFMQVDPTLAWATAAVVGGDLPNIGSRDDPVIDPVALIRLGAARQHLDAVLIYEVGAEGATARTLLAAADFTLLGGAILPTRSMEATGMAHALLIDVRSGYPYGTAQAQADLSDLATTWGADDQLEALKRRASRAVVGNLVTEVDQMVTQLAAALPRG